MQVLQPSKRHIIAQSDPPLDMMVPMEVPVEEVSALPLIEKATQWTRWQCIPRRATTSGANTMTTYHPGMQAKTLTHMGQFLFDSRSTLSGSVDESSRGSAVHKAQVICHPGPCRIPPASSTITGRSNSVEGVFDRRKTGGQAPKGICKRVTATADFHHESS